MLRMNKLPKPRLQMTMISMFVVVGSLGLIVFFALSLAKLGKLLGSVPEARVLLEQAQLGLLTELWIALALMVPVLVMVGMFVTFRVAGPLVALERYLTQLAEGEDPGECHFRRGDELRELSELATRVGDRMRELSQKATLTPIPELPIADREEELTP